MPRRKTRKSFNIVLNRYKLGALLLVLGALFFFSLFMAQESPLFTALSYPTTQLFGTYGSFVFFAFLAVLGGVILIDQKYYTKWLFKFSVILILIICGILNFSLLENGFPTQISAALTDTISSHGGRLGYLVLRGVNRLLGGATQAIKITMIFLLLGTIISIALYYRLKLPTIKLEAVRERFESNKHTAEKYSARSKKSDQHPQPTLFSESSASEKANSSLPSALRSLIKEKVHAKVQKKEDDETMRQLHISFPSDKPTFDITLLGVEHKTGPLVDENRLLAKAEGIKEKLGEFGIDVEIEGFNVGPTVIQFKIKPDSGIKIAKIEALSKDIALALKTKSLRVLAPIPGTDQVGIEIPNPTPKIVRIREVMGGLEFAKAMSNTLTNLAIGISIDGTHMVKDLESMPHLLVAGATGSGKSVSVNDFIVSLIYQNTPSELKFIMVDPKQVELGMYEGIPYLLSPIITEPGKAVKVLKRSVDFMEQRYSKLREAKVRNIAEYNEKAGPADQMYRLVIIIDELADLMMSGNKKDTETYITRIAQKARAVGIHLILATQRPSVNVITGLIKANVPTRIAFGVVSQIDSRTILDMKGAEDLVGKGDLLYIDPKTKFPLRMQAPYISTAETESIVNSIKRTYMAGISEEDIYHPEIMRILESKGEFSSSENVSDDDEDLIEQAMQLIAETRKASATMLQRKLGVGFPRAARLIDIMEERGVIGPQEGAKPREIFL